MGGIRSPSPALPIRMGREKMPSGYRALMERRLQDDHMRYFFYIVLIFILVIGKSGANETTYSRVENNTLPLKGKNLPSVRFIAVGDMMLGRGVGTRVRKHGLGWLFEKTERVLSEADILFGNLECPLTSRYAPTHTENAFKANPKLAKELARVGFNAVSVANNHSLDHGRTGLKHTLEHLKNAGIAHVGGGIGPNEPYEAKVVEKNGIKIAFIGAQNIIPSDVGPKTAGIAYLDIYHQVKEIKAVEKAVDFTVVSLHWGNEYIDTPSMKQKEIAHKFVDAGADIIIGHHSHVLQGIERYKGGLIVYSLGNFAFDQKDAKTKTGVMLVLDLVKYRPVPDPKGVPIRIRDYRPEIEAGLTGHGTLEELSLLGRHFGRNGVTEIELFDPEDDRIEDEGIEPGQF